MTFPLDKLGLVNQALALCGDNLCNAYEDGSPEWTVASAAYEAAIEYMLDQHDWKGITNVAVLQPLNGAPADLLYSAAYAKPPDCVHLILVRVDNMPVKYALLGNQILLNASGNPGSVTVKYVSRTNSNPANGALSGTFMTALLAFTQAGIYGGLHESTEMVMAYKKEGNLLLQQARTRTDQEAPKRAMFNSRIRAARRIRRPWPPVSDEWSDTGTPG